MFVEIRCGPVFFIRVENVSWKGLPQTVTLFILGQQDPRHFSLIHYPLLYYLYFAQWTSYIFINKDKFKSLKPSWGESQSLSPNRHTQPWHRCRLGLAVGCLSASLALPPRFQSSPPPETCPDPTGCPWVWRIHGEKPPGRCCPGSVWFSPSWAS